MMSVITRREGWQGLRMMSVIITKGGLAGAPDDERHYHEGRAGRGSG